MVNAVTGVAVAIGVVAILLLLGLIKAICVIKRINECQNKALIKHEKQLYGSDSAVELAKNINKIGVVKKHSKKVKKQQKYLNAVDELMNDL
ncbi:hypothetical protein P344_03480 [Spiroplasma mirum ATCC 29335]|uniref:Uncharacterized protein n=1 Tax=Spiroplasma mirum ATCC 29335 TaxID=838561 RepID=W0GQV7_9MOLU|nr:MULTISPECIES: hypothetical protein [Spiroplasma]AHF61014.1 hypothetical protein SMM_0589 [Spiroplasma mirum ATCC 29335]AHI58038.1 hypothetical protein P344_03480 [Spiroplasma mirum ATCC 29335]AKM53117.1 hypothetical protein SATRI_v1c06450 [Spiroplasma atrichopogonis]